MQDSDRGPVDVVIPSYVGQAKLESEPVATDPAAPASLPQVDDTTTFQNLCFEPLYPNGKQTPVFGIPTGDDDEAKIGTPLGPQKASRYRYNPSYK